MSTRQRLKHFLATHRGSTSETWRQQLAERARRGVAWPDPWVIAEDLGLDVRVLRMPGIRYATLDERIVIDHHADPRVVCHRLVTAIAQYLLKLSNARWSEHDVFLLAFELLMPTSSVMKTDPKRVAEHQPNAVPALVETWAEHVKRAKSA